jgi:hypothetical protein
MKSLLIIWLFLSFSTQALELPNPLTLKRTLELATTQNLFDIAFGGVLINFYILVV